jgi:hypothetical protein
MLDQKTEDNMHMALNDIMNEFVRAATKFGPMNSAHEGYAVILEEMDELWDHVKMNQTKRDMAAMRTEAVQCAAMCLKFIVNICDTNNRT